MSELCAKLHVPYIGWDVSPIGFMKPETMLADEVHETLEFHAEEATFEGDALVAAWRSAHP